MPNSPFQKSRTHIIVSIGPTMFASQRTASCAVLPQFNVGGQPLTRLRARVLTRISKTQFSHRQGRAEVKNRRCYYNFVRPHGALKFEREIRTPAM